MRHLCLGPLEGDVRRRNYDTWVLLAAIPGHLALEKLCALQKPGPGMSHAMQEPGPGEANALEEAASQIKGNLCEIT